MTHDTDAKRPDYWTQTDVILPEQLHAQVAALSDPERRLRLAVLEDALRYFQRHLDSTDRRGRVLYEDAVDWFSSPDRSEPFAFENVCDALNLDAEYVRQGLCRWRDAERARRRSSPPRDGAGAAGARTGREARRHLRAA